MWENTGEIFNWVLRASLYSVAVVFIIVIVQKLTRRALSARWIYALWLILLARLVMPAGLETKWSLWNLTPDRLTNWTAADYGEMDAVGITIPDTLATPPVAAVAVSGDHEKPVLTGETGIRRNSGGFFQVGIMQALAVVWLSGVLVMIASAAFINFRLWNSVRGLAPSTDSKLLELFEDCKRQLRIKTMTGLVVTDRVENPFLFGFIRPRVLLPADLVRHASDDQLRCVLLHELAHLKRGDIITGWLIAILQSLHWFNPVIWWAFYRMRFDREAACDALVLSRMTGETGSNYGGALIGMMERFNHPRHQPAIVAGIFENKEQLKRRLVMINNYKTPSRLAGIFAVFLIAVLSGLMLTEARSAVSAEEIENEQNANAVNTVPGGEFTLSRQADNTVGAPDRILFETGKAYLEKGQYARARLTLQTLLSTYPDSDLASEAYLAMSETYYEEEVSPGVWEVLIKYDRPATGNVD